MTHKSGFVNIIGKPNVGKSTLMNALIGEKLSIITPKAQTTRHRILGIYNDEEHQIVFSDTPGIIEPNYKMQESMMKFVDSALEDADVIVLITEAKDKAEQNIKERIEKAKNKDADILVVINKIDLSQQEDVLVKIKEWKEIFPGAEVIPISAIAGFNLEKLLMEIKDRIPKNPPYYSKDTLTNKSMRFFVSEIIREKILKHYRKEVPYSVEVVVDEYKETADIIRIKSYIYVSRESQKIIIIGQQGKAIKKVGIEARKDIEEFVSKKVYLELSVKVRKDWRDDPKELKRFGYEE
ncbi:MAG: GTPase Era [Bacteroidales bacterium]|nr:GTPase Era [Bacteroidales bacterium]MCF8386467.1 GTPase Era [Bacteroidales bacterium]MCF8399417.1 GTPase Era [Bacteroidales bacterium]